MMEKIVEKVCRYFCLDYIKRKLSDLKKYQKLCEALRQDLTAADKAIKEYEDILGSHFFTFRDMRHISRTDCNTAFVTLFGTENTRLFADNKYFTVSKDEMREFLAHDSTSRRKQYVNEYYDCDDFGFRLKGNMTTQDKAGVAFFVVWSRLHGFNAFIDHEHKVWFIEPQTDAILDPETELGSYYLDVKVVIG